jgi:hypothetical protein
VRALIWAFFGAALLTYIHPAVAAAPSFVPGSAADEAAIAAIFTSDDQTNGGHRAPDLDWENAFGIRYTDLAKREAFYSAKVTPLQTPSTEKRLELKVRFLSATLAVVDTYKHRVGQLDVATRKPGPDRWIRATALMEKRDGVWTEVLERIADLRLPYYVHYDTIPTAVPVQPQILAGWAGAYRDQAGKPFATVSVMGDHLVLKTTRRTYVLQPTSANTFLSFNPDDLAEYDKIAFETDASGRVTLSMTDMVDAPIRVLTRGE